MSKKTHPKLHWHKVPKKNPTSSWLKQIFLKSSLIIFTCVLGFVGQTNAYFSDTATTQMKMQAGCWATPPIPELFASENSASVNPGSVVFQWSDNPSSCPGVTVSYLFTLYKDLNGSPLVESPLLTTNQYVVNDLGEGTYFWLVAALDSQGHSSISEVSQLNIETLVVMSLLPAPTVTPTPVNFVSPSASPFTLLNLTAARTQSPPTIGFTINGSQLSDYIHLSYVITYESENGLQGLVGESDLSGSTSFTLDPKPLGTCTTGGTCTYHQGVGTVSVHVELEKVDGTLTSLEQTL